MAFPGNGMEGTYRNHILDVASMLRNYHGGHYRIYNLSGRSYDVTKFDKGAVQNWCSFPDHNPPPLETLLAVMSDMHAYLSSDPKNVVAVHCLAGKGRTGTIIASYMIYSGLFATAGDSLRFFAHKRSATISGVSYPGQLRYVMYAQHLFDRINPIRPKKAPIYLHSVTLSHIPKLSLNVVNTSFGITPLLEVFAVGHNKLYGQCVTPIYSSAWAANNNAHSGANSEGKSSNRSRTTSSSMTQLATSSGSHSKARTSLPPHLAPSMPKQGGATVKMTVMTPPLTSSASPTQIQTVSLSAGEIETYNYDEYQRPLEIPIDKAVRGDVLITLSHYTSSPSNKAQQLFRLNFHTGYLEFVSSKSAVLSQSGSSPSSGTTSPRTAPLASSTPQPTTTSAIKIKAAPKTGTTSSSPLTSLSQPHPLVMSSSPLSPPPMPPSLSTPTSPPPIPPSLSSPPQTTQSSSSQSQSLSQSQSTPSTETQAGDSENRPPSFSIPRKLVDHPCVFDSNDVMRTAVFRKCDIDCVHEDKRFPRDFEVILTYRVGNFSLDPSEARYFERASDAEESALNSALKTIASERPVGETCFFDPAIDNSLFPNVSAKVRMARSEMLSCSPTPGPDGIGISGNGPSDIIDESGGGCGGSTGSGATYEKTGWLTKQGEKVRSWKKRWFVLRNGTVFYYGSPKSKTPKGVIPLFNVMAVVATTQPMDSTHVHCFELVVSTSSSSSSSSSSSLLLTSSSSSPSVGLGSSGEYGMASPTNMVPSDKSGSGDKFSIRSYYICAETEEEKMDWVNSIKLAKGEDEN